MVSLMGFEPTRTRSALRSQRSKSTIFHHSDISIDMKSRVSNVKALVRDILSEVLEQKIADAEAEFAEFKPEFDAAKNRWREVEEKFDPIRNEYFEVGGQYNQWPWNEKLEEKWRTIQHKWEKEVMPIWLEEHEKWTQVRARYNTIVDRINKLHKGIDVDAKRRPQTPEEEELWRMYGGDPSERPWGLGS